MSPGISNSINNAYFTKETYEEIVHHLGRGMDLISLEDSIKLRVLTMNLERETNNYAN